jgi:hypothetical protein
MLNYPSVQHYQLEGVKASMDIKTSCQELISSNAGDIEM